MAPNEDHSCVSPLVDQMTKANRQIKLQEQQFFIFKLKHIEIFNSYSFELQQK